MALRFHWMLPKAGEVVPGAKQTPREAVRYRADSTIEGSSAPYPDLPGWTHFAHAAENAGIESVLISFSRYEPDPLVVSAALGCATTKLTFMLACRAGLTQPAAFVQQINTLSQLLGGRVSLNLVAGSSLSEQRGYGDFLPHDDRYARAGEFLTICNQFWRNGGEAGFRGHFYCVENGKLLTPFGENGKNGRAGGRSKPEVYISGHSEAAHRLVVEHGSCWLRVADTPEAIADSVKQMRDAGVSVGLRLCLLTRPTHEEAVDAVESLVPRDNGGGQATAVALKDDSVMHRDAAEDRVPAWHSPNIWTGLVPFYGPVWTTLAGTPREIAEAFLAWGEIGVEQFILSGWPELDTVETFGREVLPLIREGEACR